MSIVRDISHSKTHLYLRLVFGNASKVPEHIDEIKKALREENFDAAKVKALLQKPVITPSILLTTDTVDRTYNVMPPEVSHTYELKQVQGQINRAEIWLFLDYLYVNHFALFIDLVNLFKDTPEKQACFIGAIENYATIQLRDRDPRDESKIFQERMSSSLFPLFTWDQASSAQVDSRIKEFKTYAGTAPAEIKKQVVDAATDLENDFNGKKAKMEKNGQPAEAKSPQKYELMWTKLQLIIKINNIRHQFSQDRNYSGCVIFLTNLISSLFVPFGIANVVYRCKKGRWLLFDRDSTQEHMDTLLSGNTKLTPPELSPKLS